MDHLEYLVSFIRMKINRLDQVTEERKTEELDGEELDGEEQMDAPPVVTTASGGPLIHTYLGAPEKDDKPLLELTKFSIPNFLHILGEFINKFRTREEGYYRVQKDHMVNMFVYFGYMETNVYVPQIREFHCLRTTYRSMVNWRNNTNLLRCNESFHHQPQYDHVLITSEDGGFFFAQLLSLFQFQTDTQSHDLALIQVYSQPPGSTRRKDRDLGLHRLRLKNNPYTIVAVESIVRGALLVEDTTTQGDYFIVDTIDSDMYLRMSSLLT